MPDLLTPDWLPRLRAARRLILAFSGGLDSTVLLHCLAHIPGCSQKIIAVHVNHGLSAHASSWAQHCQSVCQHLNLTCVIEQVKLETSSNLEENAREARYAVFQSLLQEGDLLLLGHHQDDQAETLLLQLFRGAGVEGLSAMSAIKPFGLAQIARPLLGWPRQQLAAYAQQHQLSWIEDDSNSNRAYSRNFLRHEILPLLQTRWPGVAANLARTAGHCQQARDLLDDWVVQQNLDLSQATLSVAPLLDMNEAQRTQILRTWLKRHVPRAPDAAVMQRLLAEVIDAGEEANPLLTLGDYCVRRYRQTLYVLGVEEAVGVLNQAELEKIMASACEQGLVVPAGARVEVRFRQGGERFFWHGQHKSLKKLFQEWGVPGWLRGRIPLVYVDGELVAVLGYAVGDRFYR